MFREKYPFGFMELKGACTLSLKFILERIAFDSCLSMFVRTVLTSTIDADVVG